QPGIRGSAVGDALAQLVERRIVQEALLVHDVGEPQVAGVEDLQLRLHAQLADARRAGPHHVRGRDVDAGALAEVEGAAVQSADLRAQDLDVRESLSLIHQVRAVDGDRGVLRVDDEVAAHAGGHVDDGIDVRGADEAGDLRVELRLAGALLRLRVADVDVDDGGAGAGRGDAGVRDLLRSDGDVLGLAGGVARTREGAREDDGAVHDAVLSDGSVWFGESVGMSVVTGAGVVTGASAVGVFSRRWASIQFRTVSRIRWGSSSPDMTRMPRPSMRPVRWRTASSWSPRPPTSAPRWTIRGGAPAARAAASARARADERRGRRSRPARTAGGRRRA